MAKGSQPRADIRSIGLPRCILRIDSRKNNNTPGHAVPSPEDLPWPLVGPLLATSQSHSYSFMIGRSPPRCQESTQAVSLGVSFSWREAERPGTKAGRLANFQRLGREENGCSRRIRAWPGIELAEGRDAVRLGGKKSGWRVCGPDRPAQPQTTRRGVPGTPYLTAGANSGKSGRARREEALRLMAVRQARLEPLA